MEVEEAQRTDGLIEQAVRDLLDVAKEEQVLLDLGKLHAIGRAAEEQSEAGNERDVGAHGALGEIADAHRLLHPLAQGSGDHDRSPFNEIRSVDSREALRGERSSGHAHRPQPFKNAERAAQRLRPTLV
jgi:hypothetical protein